MLWNDDTDETDLQTRVEELLNDEYPDRVFAVEDGTVWVSGMNNHCWTVARLLRGAVRNEGIPTTPVEDDGVHALDNGGVQFHYGPKADDGPSASLWGRLKQRLGV